MKTLATKNTQLQNGLPQLFESIFNNDLSMFLGNDTRGIHNPAMNIAESETHFYIEVVAPGFSKEDFELNVEGKKLSLSAKVTENNTTEDMRYKRREFKKVAFEHAFTLPEIASTKKIEADYKQGILTLSIGKMTKKEKGFRNIPIT